MTGNWPARRARIWLTALTAALIFSIGAVPGHAALGVANCLVVESGRFVDGNSVSPPKYEIRVSSQCPDLKVPSYYSWYFDSGDNTGFPINANQLSAVVPTQYGTDVLSVDLRKVQPGTWTPRIRFKDSLTYSEQTVTLPRYTIQAPEPTPTPTPNTNTGSGSGGGSFDARTCMSGPGTSYQCWYDATWTFDFCFSNAGSAVLQKRIDGTWVTVQRGIATKDNCAKKLPYTIWVEGTEKSYGTKKYRIYVPSSATGVPFTIRVS